MIDKIRSTLNWLPHYFAWELRRSIHGERVQPKHVYFCICDHFEPYRANADRATARKRMKPWLEEYPKIADEYRDLDGQPLKYS